MSSHARTLALAITAGALGLATPALANHDADQRPEWRGDMPAQPGYDRGDWDRQRDDWLVECRRRHGGRSAVGGAVIGGLVGGVAGSAIAGRGNRTAGAIAGGALGAVAGAAIGDSADRRRTRDYCEGYFDDYMARAQHGGGYAYGYPAHGNGYAMQPVMVMMPVATMQHGPMHHGAAHQGHKNCTTTTEVIEEWVPAGRPHHRYIPPRPRVERYKRVIVQPSKRVRVY